MPRKPRLHVPGGVYHVILRGNNRQSIFHSNQDRLDLEALIQVALPRFDCRVHAYCWMTNHIHLAIQVADQPLSGFVQYVASQYARCFNTRQGKTGHLFERRHRALLVDGDRYLLGLVRYIHRNPIEAELTQQAQDYRWSSHQDYLGLCNHTWVHTDWILSLLDSEQKSAQQKFDRFVHQQEMDDEPGEVFSRGMEADNRILAEDQWLDALDDSPKTAILAGTNMDELVAGYCSRYGVNEQALTSAQRTRKHAMIRARIAKEAMTKGIATLAEVARRFHRAESVLYRNITRYCGDDETK